jgi:hypothetical protein
MVAKAGHREIGRSSLVRLNLTKGKLMERSRGNINAHRLFSLKELGLGNPEPYVDRVIHAFLQIGEAIAARWIQMPNGILLMPVVPENPASGAIYVYDRQLQEFFLLSFDGPDDNLTVQDFGQLFSEYNLLRYAERPALLQPQLQGAGSA